MKQTLSQTAQTAQTMSPKKKVKGKAVTHDLVDKSSLTSLAMFLDGASPAQQLQVEMLRRVFKSMDADNDGFLSVADVRAYFRTQCRPNSDAIVRKWIQDRDIDQDGAVSLPEFVASYAQQLDPNSFSLKDGSGNHSSSNPNAHHGLISPVAGAFGALKFGNSLVEVSVACSAAEGYIRKVLDAPSVSAYWRIFLNDSTFNSKIGRLFGGVQLMNALGFQPEDNGSVIALRDPSGKSWDSIPVDVRTKLIHRLQELLSHSESLHEPTVSNIAAGEFYCFCLCCRCYVIFFVSFSIYRYWVTW